MSYTGLATAIGLDIEVPHIIRLLAADLYRARAHGERLDLDQSINLYLDAGPVIPVPLSFAKAWWRVNRDPVTEEVLGPQTIDDCLKFHRQRQSVIERKREKEDAAADLVSSIDEQLQHQSMSRPTVPDHLLSKDAVTMLGKMTAACPSCLPNRNAVLKAFTKDQKHVRRFKAVRDAFQERRDAAARRAAGFLKLYEAAVAKEFEDIDGESTENTTSTKRKGTTRSKGKKKIDVTQQSTLVRERAEQELKSMTAYPHAQWAIGPTLDLNDIRGLLQFGPAGPGGEHSGYRMDHLTGPNTGRDSETASTLASPDPLLYSDISNNDDPIADLTPDHIPQLMLPGSVAGPKRDAIPTYNSRTPPIPSYHFTPIDEDIISDGSVEGNLLQDPHIDSDGAENDRDDLLAGHARGDPHNPIQILSRSPSHISLSSGSLGNAAETLEVNESVDSDVIGGPEDALGTTHSDSAMSDDDSIAGDGANYLFEQINDRDNDVGTADPGGTAIGGTDMSDEDSIAVIAGLGDVDPDNPVSSGHYSDGAVGPSDDDVLAGPEDVLEISDGEEDLEYDDVDMVMGPDDILGNSEGEEDSDNEDADMLAGAGDVLGDSEGEEEHDDEEDADDLSDVGVGERAMAAIYLRNLVAGRTAGPSKDSARDRPYTAEDFEDVPDTLFN